MEAPGPRRSPNLFWHETVDIASTCVRENLIVKKGLTVGLFWRLRRAYAGLAGFWRRAVKAFGAADERIAAFKKAEQFVGRASDADAYALADGTCGMADFAEPECFVFAEIHAVMAAIDLQGLREAAGTASEIEELGGLTMALHDFHSFERLEGAN